MRSITACAARWVRYRRMKMKILQIEIEATAEELKASNTLGEAATNFLRRVCAQMTNTESTDDEGDAEEEA